MPSLNMQARPNVTSMLSTISLHGEYTISTKITLMFGYAFERFTYRDFMTNVATNQFANALMPAVYEPNDTVQVVNAGLHIRF